MTAEKYTPLRDDPNELVRLLVEKDHEIADLRHPQRTANMGQKQNGSRSQSAFIPARK